MSAAPPRVVAVSTAADDHPGVWSPHGVFVCFEGGEGAGKSTQSKALREWLEGEGYAVRLTFEPGDTEVGRKLRQIVLDPATGELAHRTEALLYAADKAEHVDTVVLPALGRGEVVVTDRYVDSALAYQGAGRDLDLRHVAWLNRWATGDLRPHLTVVLDLEPEHGLGRFEERDRIEGESADFHLRVRDAFGAMAAADPEHYLVVDARLPADEIAGRVRDRVDAAARPGGPGRGSPMSLTSAAPIWDTLVGQRAVARSLATAAGGHGMSQAWLFTGSARLRPLQRRRRLRRRPAVRDARAGRSGLRRLPRLPHRARRLPRRRLGDPHREALHRRRRGPAAGPPAPPSHRSASAGRSSSSRTPTGSPTRPATRC